MAAAKVRANGMLYIFLSFLIQLPQEAELAKERRANPPDPSWMVGFEYGNPSSYRRGLSTLPLAIWQELGDDRVKLMWTLTSLTKKRRRRDNDDDDDDVRYYYCTTFDMPDGMQQTVHAKTVVTTIPTHAIGNILELVLPGSAELFARE